jgi:hypothetical protein
MPIKLNSTRDEASTAVLDFTFADIAPSGVAQLAVQLPQGAVVTDGFVQVQTAFNSATSDALDVGDAGSVNRYRAALNLQAVAVTPLTITGLQVAPGATDTTKLTLRWTGVGAAPTAGRARLIVTYVRVGRSSHNVG